MIPLESLKDLLAEQQLSNTDRLLLCLAVNYETPKQVKQITHLAYSNGFRGVRKLNVSQLLRQSPGRVVRVAKGWQLTSPGMKYLQQIAGPLMSSPIPKVASALRVHLTHITDPHTVAFVEEAIRCFEARQYRAAVVLSWVGAVSLLYSHVVGNHLGAFNAEAAARTSKWKYRWQPAKKADDLARMKESEFLVILERLSIIGKNVKQQLEGCLKLRNGCGHPSSYVLGEHKVSAHIEDLVLNVFSKF